MSKYQAYPEYKDSGVEWVGSIPTHWICAKTAHFFKVAMGQTILKEDLVDDGEWPVFSATEGDHYFGRVNDPNIQLNIGDIVIPARGNSIGAIKLVKEKATTSQTTIYCKQSQLNKIQPSYIYYFFSGGRKNLFRFTQTAIPQITTEEIGSNPILIPTLEEQENIANFLDHETAKIDTLIDKQQQLIQLLKEKRQAVISHAVTKGLNPNAPMRDSGVEWLGEVPRHWELPKLIHQTSRIGDGLHSTPLYQDNTGYYFVNGNNLVNGQILVGETAKEVPDEEYKKHYIYLDESSVLLSINGTIGNVARYNNEMVILGKSAAYMNCSGDLLPEYLMLYLQSSQALHYFDLEVTGTTIFNLSLNSIRQMKVCVPPEIEQLEINDFCKLQKKKYDTLIEKASVAIRLMQERRTALISAAVTGKIDVRHYVSRPSGNDPIGA